MSNETEESMDIDDIKFWEALAERQEYYAWESRRDKWIRVLKMWRKK